MVGPPPESWAIEPDLARTFDIAPGLWSFRLPLPWPSITHVNAYAIEHEDGIVLVDCGSAGDASHRGAIVAALGLAGFTIEDVRVLVGTHTHSDHVGLAAWVIERSGAEFWMHPDTGHFYDGTREPERIAAARERRSRREGVPERVLEFYADVREETDGVLGAVAPDRPLAGGVKIESKLGDWEVIETPGHCPTHVCLVQRDRRLIILGDLVASAFSPWFDYGYSADPVAEYLSSLDTIEALGPFSLALPGHGRPIENLPEAIALHRRGVAERLEQTLAAIAAGPTGAYELTYRVFGDLDDQAGVWKMTEIFGYLKHLRLAGKVTRDEDMDGTFSYRLAG
ncbi:MAG TPA: MBL fold metallo-hydrolase [Solirubrobacteraceae bacterium]|nr:MBL fold metallo-hydrolase [Solirubrobacteraceae bacterium]